MAGFGTALGATRLPAPVSAKSDLITDFAKFSARQDREAMVAAVENNIGVFEAAKSRLLLAVGEPRKTRLSIAGGPVPAPEINFFYLPEGANLAVPSCFLARWDDPTTFFPNLGFVNSIDDSQTGDDRSARVYIQGIGLGRTEHPFASENAGPLTLDISYFGLYFGDPVVGGPVSTCVVPVFAGFRGEEPGNTWRNGRGIIQPDAPPPMYPRSDGGGSLMDKCLETLDMAVGTGVVELGIGAGAAPSFIAPRLEPFVELGFPQEFVTEEYFNKETDATFDLFRSLLDATLVRALTDGYTLTYFMGAPTTMTLPILDVFPYIQGMTMSQALRRLPDLRVPLENPRMTVQQLLALPRLFAFSVALGSESIN